MALNSVYNRITRTFDKSRKVISWKSFRRLQSRKCSLRSFRWYNCFENVLEIPTYVGLNIRTLIEIPQDLCISTLSFNKDIPPLMLYRCQLYTIWLQLCPNIYLLAITSKGKETLLHAMNFLKRKDPIVSYSSAFSLPYLTWCHGTYINSTWW